MTDTSASNTALNAVGLLSKEEKESREGEVQSLTGCPAFLPEEKENLGFSGSCPKEFPQLR